MVESLEVVVVSETSFNISWKPPLSPNGILTEYQLTVINLLIEGASLANFTPSVLETTMNIGIGKFIVVSRSTSTIFTVTYLQSPLFHMR